MKKILNFFERMRFRRSIENSICSGSCESCEDFEKCYEFCSNDEYFNPISRFEFYCELVISVLWFICSLAAVIYVLMV